MRLAFAVIFAGLVGALAFCARAAHRSRKPIGPSLTWLLLALIPPVIGNLILVASRARALSTVGCYIYFVGMDLVMLALLRFTGDYCDIALPRAAKTAIFTLLGADALQLLLNPITGHAFAVEEILAYGAPYYRLVPFLGQTFHRVVDYGILAAVMVLFVIKLIRSPRINFERYFVILATMVVTTIWETLYIFSRTPIDRSMVGFGVFGLLVYFFSLYYRPLRLLDRLLAAVAAEIPDALYFFDVSGRCIWANKRGMELAELEENDYELATQRLEALLGSTGAEEDNWSGERIIGSGDAVRSYVMERRAVTDDKGQAVGSLLTVRDNSAEQKLLQKEIYNATHDSLTRLYNRAGYELLLSHLDLRATWLLLVDGDGFKAINDRYGHEVGDRTLQKIARTMERSFRAEDHICRIGGDEFVILMHGAPPAQAEQIRARVRRINAELADGSDGLPPISVSVGVAGGDTAGDSAELFDRADRALYQTKRQGRCGVTFYTELGA